MQKRPNLSRFLLFASLYLLAVSVPLMLALSWYIVSLSVLNWTGPLTSCLLMFTVQRLKVLLINEKCHDLMAVTEQIGAYWLGRHR